MCHAAVRVNSISIHSLRIEGDSRCRNRHCVTEHFNPLPPHGGRLTRCLCFSAVNFISIHSLRMEGDVPPDG